MITSPSFQGSDPALWRSAHRNPELLCVWRTESSVWATGCRGPSSRRIRADRAQDEGRLEDEGLARARGIPPDDLRHPLEPVPHGVGVDEQLARRRLEGTAVVEVAPQGRDEVGAVLLQRAVDLLHQRLLRERVAGESA